MTATYQLDEQGLAHLVHAFYERVRADDLIGPVFNEAIHDWPHHLEHLTAFWSSVMLSSGRFKGQPIPAHMKHRDRITPAMFDRWLSLWGQTTGDLMPENVAAELQAKAARIAESLKLMLFFNPADLVKTGAR